MIGEKQKRLRLVSALLVIGLVFSACSETLPTSGSPSATAHQDKASETPSPSPSATTPPKDTHTPTSEPSPLPTQTATPTATPVPPNLSLTPLPVEVSPITTANLDQVEPLAIWGNGAPNKILLSGDNSLLAVATGLGTFLYDSFDFRFLALLRSEQPVSVVAFSPNNAWIAVIEGPTQLKIYSQPQFEPIEDIQLSKYPKIEEFQHTLFFSPDSEFLTLIIETNEEITVTRWKVATWESDAQFSIQAGLESFVNPSIGVLGVITNENLILHSLVLPGDSRTLPLHPNRNEVMESLQISNPSPIIPAASGDFLLLNQGARVAYWDILDNKIDYELEDYPLEETDPCKAIPDTCRNQAGDFSFSCHPDLASSTHPIHLLTITPDDLRMLISLNSKRTELRSTFNGELIWLADEGYAKALFALNDQFVLGLRADGVLEKRDLLDGELLLSLQQHPSRFFDMAFSADGSLLAAGFNDSWIRVFNTQTGEMLGVLEGSATRLQFSPDGDLLTAGLVDGTLRVFELDRGRFFDLESGHLSAVTGITFSPDGLRLTATSLDCTISHWDLKNRYRTNLLAPLRESPIQILDFIKSSDNPVLYAAGEMEILAVDGESVTRVFSPGHDDSISNIALSQDNQYLAAGGTSLWLFKLDETGWTSLPIQTPPALKAEGFHVAFLSEAGVLLAVNQETLAFYDLQENQTPVLIHQVQLPPSFGLPVAINPSPQGDLIAIASENGLLYIYGIDGPMD